MDIAKNLKLIIFDFDGTLHDLDINWDDVKKAVGIYGTKESLGDAINRFKSEKSQTALKTITKFEMDAIKGKKIDQATARVLKILQNNYEVAIFSRNSRKMIENLLGYSGLNSFYVVGREDVDKIKPHPSGLHKILSYFGFKSDQSIFVGDTVHDVKVAYTAGMPSVIVGANFKALESSDKKPDYHLNSLTEITDLLEAGV